MNSRIILTPIQILKPPSLIASLYRGSQVLVDKGAGYKTWINVQKTTDVQTSSKAYTSSKLIQKKSSQDFAMKKYLKG